MKYHVNTTRNERPTHVYQNIGSFWNAAEMEIHVNRTCFHAGLKSQTSMSSFHLSCELNLNNKLVTKKVLQYYVKACFQRLFEFFKKIHL